MSLPLQGLTVAVTRSPDRSAALATALSAAGAVPVLVPLLDFEIAADQDGLGAALERLRAGKFDWLVVSSITTVRALKQWAAAHDTSLADLLPAQTRVATIGPSSRKILEAEGVRVDLAPRDVQSAAGLVELWPDGRSRVLLPQSDIAEPTLARGIAAKGAQVDSLPAYRTVDYPARPAARLTTALKPGTSWRPHAQSMEFPPAPETAHSLQFAGTPHDAAQSSPSPGGSTPSPELLTPGAAKTMLAVGRIDAVVAASGSAARSIARLLGPLPPSCLLIAIGVPTRTESENVGLLVAGTADEPTPAGIVEALTRAVLALDHQANSAETVPESIPYEIPETVPGTGNESSLEKEQQ
ncbi:uroporphyrinogen-III synthase [Paenarthrobacter sp. Z7-10]|uniref:uroporphyrinogen-III synthase n=1 Tax=Paenarthrobacter sp. Z7-10 TaxID=2787635 RepID=UPI0022A902CC|nr:uroporphyrinogen-III synthase [Paenarthrobacter sp. Z7-10]